MNHYERPPPPRTAPWCTYANFLTIVNPFNVDDNDNVNDNQRTAVQYDDVNDNFGSAMIAHPDGWSTLVQTSEMQASLQSQSESSQVSMTESLTSTLTLSLEKKSTLKTHRLIDLINPLS